MPTPIYILHIISNVSDPFHQKTFSMCVNEFIEQNVGHFKNGRFVHEELPKDIIYHREFLDAGYWPPSIIVDLIKWLENQNIWTPWMGQFDTFAIIKQYLDSDKDEGVAL